MVFILADPVILLPGTLRYMLHYAGEGTMTHHGYLMMGHLRSEEPGHLRGGMPIYFYLLFLTLKTPLPVLVALIVGLSELWKRRREPGPFFMIFMFVFWIVPFSLVGAKWLRYMLSWMPAVYIISAVGLVRIGRWASAKVGQTRRQWAPALAAAVALMFVAEAAWVAVESAPYYTLYLNPLGLGRTGHYFPHDEENDMGLREAIKHIAREAPNGAYVGGASECVFAYYLHKFGRDDLHYFDLSDRTPWAQASPSAYLVIQDGRKYFENISSIREVEASHAPLRTVEIGGAEAVRVYREYEASDRNFDQVDEKVATASALKPTSFGRELNLAQLPVGDHCYGNIASRCFKVERRSLRELVRIR